MQNKSPHGNALFPHDSKLSVDVEDGVYPVL